MDNTEGNSTSSQSFCQVCTKKESLYRCPACFTLTCSLKCCQMHKATSGCSGKRDRTCFIALNKFTDSDLKSDYYFLEDIIHASEASNRLKREMRIQDNTKSSSKKRKVDDNSSSSPRGDDTNSDIPVQPLLQLAQGRRLIDEYTTSSTNETTDSSPRKQDTNPNSEIVKMPLLQELKTKDSDIKESTSNNQVQLLSQDWLQKYPQGKQRLVQQASQRSVNLLLMPQGMQRGVINRTTKYDQKKDCITWKVEFQLHVYPPVVDATIPCSKCSHKGQSQHSSHVTKSLFYDRIEETNSITQPLSQILRKNLTHSAPSDIRSIAKHFCETSNTNQLKDDVCILMKKLPCQSSRPIYHRLNAKSCLADMLKGMTVIEFPTLEIVLKQDLKNFPLLVGEVQ